MADVNVTDLTQETYSTLDGTEQVIMFDSAEGKRATVQAVGEYVLKKLTTSLNGSTQTVADALSSLNSDLTNRFNIVSTGSVFDITETGLHYLTAAVTDKPEVTGSSRGGLIVMKWSAGVQSYVQYVFFQGIQNGEVWKCLTYTNNSGTLTNYGWEKVYSNANIQCGSISSITVSAASYKDVSVTFDTAFSSAPKIFVTMLTGSTAYGMGNVSYSIASSSNTGFTLRVYNNDSADRTPSFNWQAIL